MLWFRSGQALGESMPDRCGSSTSGLGLFAPLTRSQGDSRHSQIWIRTSRVYPARPQASHACNPPRDRPLL